MNKPVLQTEQKLFDDIHMRGGLSRRPNCLDTVKTIVLESFFRADLPKGYTSARLLQPDVLARALECTPTT